MSEELIQVSMNIILHAGNAREQIMEVFERFSENDFKQAKTILEEANENIKTAHRAQTDIIQEEARGNKPEASLLVAHAQATLMNIKREWNIADQLTKVYKGNDESISAIQQ